MRAFALVFLASALRLFKRAAQPDYMRHSTDPARPPEGGWMPPWAVDQCLPFPHGCGHLLHMCGVLSFSEFNTTCTRYGFEVKYAFDECRNVSVMHQPIGMLPEMVAFGNSSEDAAASNESTAALGVYSQDPEEVAFASCMAKSYPATPCHDVCDDLTRASVPLGEVCEKTCGEMASCFSSCSMQAVYPTPVAACVGQCMGPVDPDMAGTVAPVDQPECTTLECQWMKMASVSADSAYFHVRAGVRNAKTMVKATTVQREMTAAKTTPEPVTTPFPWDKLKRRLSDHGDDPFAAFSPATPLPDVIPTPLPAGEGPVTDSDGQKEFWKPVQDEIAKLETMTPNATFTY